jgi:glycine dehydrogenase subunit 1
LTRYTSATDTDREAMLAAIGVGSVQELFERQVPPGVRLGRALDLPEGMAEQEVYDHLRGLAARNVSCEEQLSFLGAGMYDHYVPAVVDMLLERSEFLTPYTPYQPEIAQGGLQAMFEYQTAISELTGLPVSNASVYEGPSAVAAAAYMAKLHNGRSKIVASAGLHPHALATLRTYAHGYGMEIVEAPLRDGATDPDAWAAAIGPDTSAAIAAQPNFYGVVEDLPALTDVARRAGGERLVTAAQVDPIVLGILASPGECGVDVAVGEGQALGNRLDFGGPSFGFFAAGEEYLRRMPGRIAGETTDVDGRRGFVLTLQTREQHIRREKATSNICTAQALNALAGVVYLSWLGRQGIVELGRLLLARTQYAREALGALPGVEPLHGGPAVREFAVRLTAPGDGDGQTSSGDGQASSGEGAPADVAQVRRRCIEQGVNPGADLHALTGREQDRGGLLVAITERRTRADIDRLAHVLGQALAAAGGDAQQSHAEAVA